MVGIHNGRSGAAQSNGHLVSTAYDMWKLASPPEADEEDLTDVNCRTCDWEGNVVAYVSVTELTWQCPSCGHEYSEDPRDRFGPDPDDTSE